jgi:hypothetical protein
MNTSGTRYAAFFLCRAAFRLAARPDVENRPAIGFTATGAYLHQAADKAGE